MLIVHVTVPLPLSWIDPEHLPRVSLQRALLVSLKVMAQAFTQRVFFAREKNFRVNLNYRAVSRHLFLVQRLIINREL